MSYYVNPHHHSSPWYPYAEQFGAPNLNWCEAHLGVFWDQPANTFSNISYCVVALALCWFAYRSKQKELMIYVGLLFGLGVASFIYHLSNNYLTQVIDYIGMFAILFWMLTLNLRRLKVLPKGYYTPLMLAAIAIFCILVHVMYLTGLKFQLLIPFIASVILGLELVCHRSHVAPHSYRALWFGGFFVAIAALFSLLDITGVVCDPHNHLFQGHALWHVASSLGLGAIYFHYHQFDYN